MKIIKVENCKYCPNIHKWIGGWGATRYACSKKCEWIGMNYEMKRIENIDEIPDWCPLEDYKK